MICAFYSYKGGVGRTMALANVAELCCQAGLNTLIVDWDLEAPGLERYLPAEESEAILGKPGLMEMLLAYKAKMAQGIDEDAPFELESPTRYMVNVTSNAVDRGQLKLITAGRRSQSCFAEYASSVLAFDWQDFYRNWEGELYLEWLRQQFEALADITFIDTRTGVTEMAGVCTYHLADTVVMFCTANRQSIDGTSAMVRSLLDPRVKDLRGGRPVNVIVVPARVEDRAEADLFKQFAGEFAAAFDPRDWPDTAPKPFSAQQMWDLRIPHVPYYAFQESVVAREPADQRHGDIYASFVRLYACLRLLDSERLPEIALPSETVARFGASRAVLASDTGRRYAIVGDSVLVGRSDPANELEPDIDLSSEPEAWGVSRRHARITLIGERWFIEDLRSSNGTFLRTRDDVAAPARIGGGELRPLTDGSVIQLGRVRLTFHCRAA